mmetsp:Transcript_24844/g.36756  ORF Transcript_24844/g.36756 Transcript_24844/m.36756 type:complete len:174 (+) Transcript_24844:325-846(+)|eukprot:CAMPEP_0194226620 /NCGR_PEP_ID=MMETSP0156-20130528/42246_1 /TAXON_ID=33649 /ORGANISM="Thalassionema nitzschioides, Strain L26-B" /LENGTH=173 /DNA_ID=CAMNT_0038959043 /DNA_START=272 /DNA_END=793 /DNA_ORIENTATION=+
MNNKEELLQGETRLLELGAGLGRCGILARLLAPKTCEVFLTDSDTDALFQLRANVILNHLSPVKENNIASISCHQLLWGENTARAFLARHGGKFDVIIGSDLVYVPNVIQPLMETVSVLLSKSRNGIFVMAHCARRQGNEVRLEMIFDAAEQAGLEYNLLQEDNDIYLYSFRW